MGFLFTTEEIKTIKHKYLNEMKYSSLYHTALGLISQNEEYHPE